MPLQEVLPYSVSPEVEVTVFQSQVIAAIGIVFYCKWWGLGFIEHFKRRDHQLNIACYHFWVLVRPFRHFSCYTQNEFPSQRTRFGAEVLVRFHVKYQLCDSIFVPQVDKSHASQVA